MVAALVVPGRCGFGLRLQTAPWHHGSFRNDRVGLLSGPAIAVTRDTCAMLCWNSLSLLAHSSRTRSAAASVRGTSFFIGIHQVIGSVYRKLRMPWASSNATLLSPS